MIFSTSWQFSTPSLTQKPHPLFFLLYWNHQRSLELVVKMGIFLFPWIYHKKSLKTIGNSYLYPKKH